MDYWVGNAGQAAQAVRARSRSPAPGDGPRQTIALALKPGDGPASSTPPASSSCRRSPPARCIWLQPRFTNGTGKEQWGQAIAVRPGRPAGGAEAGACWTSSTSRDTRRDVELITFTSLLFQSSSARVQPEGFPLKATLTEHVLRVHHEGRRPSTSSTGAWSWT